MPWRLLPYFCIFFGLLSYNEVLAGGGAFMKKLGLPIVGIILGVAAYFLIWIGGRLQWQNGVYQGGLGEWIWLAGLLCPIVGTLLGIMTLATKPRTTVRMMLGAVSALSLPAFIFILVYNLFGM